VGCSYAALLGSGPQRRYALPAESESAYPATAYRIAAYPYTPVPSMGGVFARCSGVSADGLKGLWLGLGYPFYPTTAYPSAMNGWRICALQWRVCGWFEGVMVRVRVRVP
jgi:hypothetical protein